MQFQQQKSHPGIDLTGHRFSRLTVVKAAPVRRMSNGKTRRFWLCRCDCGAEIETRPDQLKGGVARSCGCLQREIASKLGRARATETTIALRAVRRKREAKGLPSNLGVRDLIGQRFSQLTVLEFVGVQKQRSLWACVCDCGGATVTTASRLNFGHTKSCGCLQREQTNPGHEPHNFRHGHATDGCTPEYWTWCSMKQRCLNPNYHHFENYGGRGIKVCARWLNSFENFLADMGLKPSPDLTLDRKNNDGHYNKRNCRWATAKEQASNRRSWARRLVEKLA